MHDRQPKAGAVGFGGVKGVKNGRFVAGIDIFRAPAIMNASYFMNGILLTLSR